MTDAVVLGQAMSNNLLAIKDVQSAIDRTSLRLASGLKVNSAIENPQDFFASNALSNRSNDLQRLLDGLGRSTQAIKTALDATTALSKLIDQADAIATESQRLLKLGQVDPDIFEFELDATLSPLSSQILADNPDAYFALGDTAGAAINQGAGGAGINGAYQGGVTRGAPGLYENGGLTSTDFNGTTGRILIPDSPLINLGVQPVRTVELVFNADTVAGRQILYEEGGNTNSLNMYIDNGTLYFHSRDAGDFQVSVNTPVVAGETYHAALVFDSVAGTLRGYLNGAEVGVDPGVTRSLSSHNGNIGIGSLQDSSFMHDGSSPSNTFRFDGRISDVAIYNEVLSAGDMANRFRSMSFSTEIEFRHRAFEAVMTEIDNLVRDASYRGVALLNDQSIVTDFNERRTSTLETTGVDFTNEGLGIRRNDFNDAEDLQRVIDSIGQAREQVRAFGNTLVGDLNIINTRRDFIVQMSNTLDEGSDKLTVADQNEEGANLLASQTRLAVAQTALRLARDSQVSILRLFG